ncbi:MAG: TIM barrel protein [Armatimonadetes bacterium]|nr:TIM barrel protein [Armatimonadota bacterium]
MRIGTQLYIYHQYWAARGEDPQNHFAETLDEVAGAGLDGVEGSLEFLRTHDEPFSAALAAAGLALGSMYAGGNLHEEIAADATIQAILELAPRARELGALGITFNPQPRLEPRKSDAELQLQAANLDRLGAGLRDLDLTFQVHTHSPEMVDDAREFRSLLDLTHPDYVGLCLDTHWIYRGGGDVPATASSTSTSASRTTGCGRRRSSRATWTTKGSPPCSGGGSSTAGCTSSWRGRTARPRRARSPRA